MYSLPSTGSEILFCHLIFAFVGLYCSQVSSTFLLLPAPWMPAEGAVIAQSNAAVSPVLAVSQHRYLHASHCEQIGMRASKSSDLVSSQWTQ